MRNAGLKFVCQTVGLRVENTDTKFTGGYQQDQVIEAPVAHHDGNYFADAETHKRLTGEGQVAFRYSNRGNPNGSLDDIAGIFNETGTVLGMMPHPERVVEPALGGTDGVPLFEHLANNLG